MVVAAVTVTVVVRSVSMLVVMVTATVEATSRVVVECRGGCMAICSSDRCRHGRGDLDGRVGPLTVTAFPAVDVVTPKIST